MSITRDDLTELNRRITQDVLGRLSDDGVLLEIDARVYATVFAGVAHGIIGYIDYKAQQVFAHSADKEHLIEHAWFWLRDGPKPAVSASRVATFGGVTGAIVPASTVLRNALGVMYATDESVELIAGAASVTARAVVAGAAGNDETTALTLVSPVAGVNNEVVATAASGGSDEEDIEVLRERVLEKQAARPMYGKRGDYAIWAKDVPGITRAWERYPVQGEKINWVGLYVLRDNDTSPVPDATELATVQDYIDTVRPERADVEVLAPRIKYVDYVIRVSPSTPEVKAGVRRKIEELFKQDGAPGCVIFISRVRSAVSSAAGELDNAVTGDDVICAVDEVPLLGTIAWV